MGICWNNWTELAQIYSDWDGKISEILLFLWKWFILSNLDVMGKEAVAIYISTNKSWCQKRFLLWESAVNFQRTIRVNLSSEFFYDKFVALKLYIGLQTISYNHLDWTVAVNAHDKHPWSLTEVPAFSSKISEFAHPSIHTFMALGKEGVHHEIFKTLEGETICSWAIFIKYLSLKLLLWKFETEACEEVLKLLEL